MARRKLHAEHVRVELLDAKLRRSLERWTKRWNLNADWCRDHGLAVLRNCLFNGGLQDAFLHPHKPKSNPYIDPPKAETFKWHKTKGSKKGKPNNWLTIVWMSVSSAPLQDYWDIEHPKEKWIANVTASREVLKELVFNGPES